MIVARKPRASDQYGRYYTDSEIAGLLVESMAVSQPNLAIELGAGDGALVKAASRFWLNTKFVTVDIDRKAKSASFDGLRGPLFIHHTRDALDHCLSDKIGVRYGEVDTGICNPPYIRPRWRAHFGSILEDAGLSNVIPKIGSAAADVLFLAQNLRFLRPGGKLGVILPDGCIAGETYATLRKTLASVHCIQRIIELPRSVFRNTEAKAHIVVLAKRRSPQECIAVQSLGSDGLLSEEIRVHPERAAGRLDYSYLRSREKEARTVTKRPLRDVTLSLSRGSYSSSQRAKLRFPVFHTSDFLSDRHEVAKRWALTRSKASVANGVIARPGDILLARVGRRLEEKLAVVRRGQVVISDCVLRLRVQPAARERVLKRLASVAGRAALAAASHGVAARFITTDALLNIDI
jgi:type I restriction enzyme M protein